MNRYRHLQPGRKHRLELHQPREDWLITAVLAVAFVAIVALIFQWSR